LGDVTGPDNGRQPTAPDHDPQPFPASMAWLLDNPLARIQAKRLVRRLPVVPGMRVVDVGSGPGRLTVPVARVVGDEGEVLAVDLQPEMLAIVRRRAARAGLHNIRTLRAAAGDGSIPAGPYDLVLLVTVLGEIAPDRRGPTIQEIAARLRPGGRLVVVEAPFDPHRQSRDAVLSLAWPAGLELEREERGWLASILQLRRPV
jgi:ubiquinone/menaquinone biosynthesis C-methylase UbiE